MTIIRGWHAWSIDQFGTQKAITVEKRSLTLLGTRKIKTVLRTISLLEPRTYKLYLFSDPEVYLARIHP